MKKIQFSIFMTVTFICLTSLCVQSQTIKNGKSENEISTSDNTIKAVTLNGKLLTTDIRFVNGKAYIPVADIAKALGLSLQIDSQSGTMILRGQSETETDDKETTAAKNAIMALKALRSVISSGTSVQDYQTRKTDAKIIVDRFLNEYKSNPAYNDIANAMKIYQDAGEFMDYHIVHVRKDNTLWLIEKQLLRYTKTYPEIKAMAHDVGDGFFEISMPDVLNMFWNKADKSTDEASSILK